MHVESIQPFGVRVSEVDLNQPEPPLAASLVELLKRHDLLVACDQNLDADGHVAATEIFGPVLDERGTGARNTYVSNVREDSVAPGGPSPYHQDGSFLADPFPAISLHAVRADQGAAATCFASNVDAYAALPSALREHADRCSALHEFSAELRQAADGAAVEQEALVWSTVHPLVVREGERPFLFLNSIHTKRIVELDDAAGAALRAQLEAVIYDAANVVEHRWRTGDFVIWNNLRVQHARTTGAPGAVRDLSRTVVGDSATAAQYRAFMEWYRAPN